MCRTVSILAGVTLGLIVLAPAARSQDFLAVPEDAKAKILDYIKSTAPAAKPRQTEAWALRAEHFGETLEVKCNGQAARLTLVTPTFAHYDLSSCFKDGQRNRLNVKVSGKNGSSRASYEVLRQGAAVTTENGERAGRDCTRRACAQERSEELWIPG